jgi:hypothetical protein
MLYDTSRWRDLRSRALAQGASCQLSGLAGECLGPLHVHHRQPVSEGGSPFPRENELDVLCARHHRLVHAWRRKQEPQRKRCPHNHRYEWARQECERRLNAA